jgi:hypothetical protein
MASVTDSTPVRRTSNLNSSSLGTDSTDPGPRGAASPDVDKCASKTLMVSSSNPSGGLFNLTQQQVKALQVQIGYALSNFNPSAVDPYNRVGKYLLPGQMLVEAGYIKEDYYALYGSTGESAAVQIPAAWTGNNSINNLTDFLNALELQENLIFVQLNELYTDLLRNNGIKSGDKPATIMGMLFVAHVSSANDAKRWRDTGIGKDVSGYDLGDFYSLGKYAATVLAAPTGII